MPERTLAQKLFVKPGWKILLVHAPPGFQDQLGPMPKGAHILHDLLTVADMIQVFVQDCQQLDQEIPSLKAHLKPGGAFWICYRKGSTAKGLDLNRDTLHAAARAHGLEGVSLISIDDTWSAMRFKVIG